MHSSQMEFFSCVRVRINLVRMHFVILFVWKLDKMHVYVDILLVCSELFPDTFESVCVGILADEIYSGRLLTYALQSKHLKILAIQIQFKELCAHQNRLFVFIFIIVVKDIQ